MRTRWSLSAGTLLLVATSAIGSIHPLHGQQGSPTQMATLKSPLTLSGKVLTEKISSFNRNLGDSSSLFSWLDQYPVLQPRNLENIALVVQSADPGGRLNSGNYFYSWGQFDRSQRYYRIARRGGTYLDPVTNELLGLEMKTKGFATLIASYPDVTVFKIVSAWQSIHRGDQLLPARPVSLEDSRIPEARVPQVEINGQIIAILDSTDRLAEKGYTQGSLIAINQGLREGLQKGDGLSLSDETDVVGFVMVLQVFDKMSYGLVIESSRPAKVGNVLRAP